MEVKIYTKEFVCAMGIDKEGKILRVHNDNQPGKRKESFNN